MATRALALALLIGGMVLGGGRDLAAQTVGPSQLFLPHISAGGCADYHETFDQPGRWFTGERDGLLAELDGGEYRLRIDRPGHVWLVGAPDCHRFDHEAAVDVRWAGEPGNFYGLLFAIEGELDQAHMLAVDGDAGVWLVLASRPEGLEFVVEPTYHEAIRPGGETNRLSAARHNGRVVLTINGVVVDDIADPSPGRPVTAGLVAATTTGNAPADARFDNLSITN